ncbi:N4-gp56 family major capsid protein [Streptococcus cuniculi]|uniref:N4-gp56 family major capsid protein n=1 Tax=Streptococcus cuniculi TaxID=1432788 RepID=A0A4Y9JD89_9STRE|nr:N4-gp56 family major capsid protein [Streptococcus cuniculi]MBF0778177.1 N4-gp56 family major capsid protein [Streptococcus cuniculi]TFU97919.1 N4-gp56 family major capsid protein [Streptococcus cuniculi]
MAENTTMMAQMLDPQVLAPMIDAEIGKAIRFAPLAEVDTTLQGRPGTTLTVPKWDYIGDAVEVGEGEPIPASKLGFTQTQMTIKKIGKSVELTDESLLSGYGDPAGQAAKQIAEAIDHKVDADVLTALQGSTQTVTASITVDGVSKALDIFNDEDDAETVLVMNPQDASALRIAAGKEFINTETGVSRLISGTYGDILGVQIIRSRKCPKGTGFMVRKGALKILLKRETMVETDRDKSRLINKIIANKHYGVYLYKAEKAIKITFAPSV